MILPTTFEPGQEATFTFRLLLLLLIFLGPRGPLRTPLVPVSVVRPQQKFQTLSSRNLSFLFLQTLSSSNLSHSTQYTEH